MSQQPPDTKAPTSRRNFFTGAAAVGVTAAVATSASRWVEDAPPAQALPPAPDNGGGYSLSEHVKRYYQTACV
jgi:hypothetical protein